MKLFIASLVICALAGTVGVYADRKADEFNRQIANIPPADSPPPQQDVPVEQRPIVGPDDMPVNPFEGRNKAGKLVHRDPKLRAKEELVETGPKVSRVAYRIAFIAPVLGVMMLGLARLRRAKRIVPNKN